MKNFHGMKIGGIRQKVFALVLITIILLVAAFASVLFYQSRRVTDIVRMASDSQRQSITEISEETMTAVLDSNQKQKTIMEAYIAQDLFGDAVSVVNIVADYTGKLFADPDAYPKRAVAQPDLAKDGEISMQLLTEEGVDVDDAQIAADLGLISNLSELMMAVYANANVDSCYVALPSGVMLLVDNHSSSKFDKNGNIIPIPIRQRLWYTGAIESGKLHFTDVTSDLFTGQISIMCSLPVYQEGQLVAVIGADLFLNDVAQAVNSMASNGSFICIVNQNGHVLFSPQTEGVFQVLPAEQAKDLRNDDNKELAAFVNKALVGSTDFELVEVDGAACYMVGAPIANVGWAILSIVPKSLADKPTEAMLTQFNTIQSDATGTLTEGMSSSKATIFVLIAVVFALAAAAAIFLSGRIVKPLMTITSRVQSLGGDNLQFFMEDTYRTRDEIQVLAEAFAMLSDKTVQYIAEVQRVTAEKERIGAELSLATRIQADMLPNVFPPFPERKEFDIYASMKPAKAVGGDFYDFFLVDDDHLCLVMADVSGKGIPAALFMMASKIILANNAMMGKSPAQILSDTNAAICSNNREEMFVTVWLGILEISTGKLIAANAGHEYPIFKQAGGKFELFKDKHGLAIGAMSGVKYREYEIQLTKGAKLFVYTDGVPEAINDARQFFGTERLLDVLNLDTNASPLIMLNAVQKAVNEFVLDAEQFDDLTMLGIEYRGKDMGNSYVEIEVDAERSNFLSVLSFVEENLAEIACPTKIKRQIAIAVEEVFINIASYAYAPDKGKAIVRIDTNKNLGIIAITFIDNGKPFDPTQSADPDTTLAADERQFGGLGIFMTKKLMDEVVYEYMDGQNILTLKKSIE